MDNWQAIATSAKHDAVPNDESLHVLTDNDYNGKTNSMGGTSNINNSWQQQQSYLQGKQIDSR